MKIACVTALCALFFAGVAAGQPTGSAGEPPGGEKGASNAAGPADSERSATGEATRLEPVQVTGTRLPRAATQSAQEVRTYDRSRIEGSGRTTLADFLSTVPEVSINSVESTFGATSVRLRGAREGSTLILINGRRTQSITGSAALIGFFDLNTIPLSMIERIDVLPTGSSAIYGGEALTGVVNIVLRSNFDGAEASVGYKGAKNTDEKLVSAGAGWNRQSTRFSIMGSYSDRSSLSGADRDITANSDLRRFGGPNLATPFLGSPATIFSVSGNLPGLDASFAAVPRGSSGVGLTPSDFAATAGTQNLGSFNAYQQILNDLHRAGIFLSAEHRFDNGIDLFAELLASDYKLGSPTTPAALLLTTVPATNAFNPFGTAVRAAGVVLGAEPLATFTFSEEFLRPLVGMRGRLSAWDWELSALYSRDRGRQVIHGQPNTAALAAALASSDPATALNPFVDGPMASPELLASIYRETLVTDWKGDAAVLNGFVRGPLLRLPAGTLDAVLGSEYEESSLARGMTADRTVTAAFAEFRAPVLAGLGERGTRRELLALQVAARHDRYSDFGNETTWQAGLEFRPLESLLLRAAHSTAFKPPTLFNLAAPVSSSAIPVVDPLRGRESVVVQSISGGNPNLDPTTGRSSTLGTVWSPRGVRLNASLTWWRLRIDSAINLPSVQFIIDNESLYPGRVLRAPASGSQVGQIIAVDRTYINFGSMRQEGFDAAVDWTFRTAWGEFAPAIAATYMTEFKGASTPGSPDVDRLSRANSDGIFAPRLKGTVLFGWAPTTTFRASLAGRYVGRYTDYTPPRTLGSFWYLDGALEIAVGRLLGITPGSQGGLKMFISGTNLTDKEPPWSTHFRGYDIYNYDIIGRTIFVRLQLQS